MDLPPAGAVPTLSIARAPGCRLIGESKDALVGACLTPSVFDRIVFREEAPI